jgi:hypothetical protein
MAGALLRNGYDVQLREVPHRVYKYFAPERVETLERRLLRYTQLGAFNDPFEGRPEITDISTLERTTELTDQLLPKSIAENYESLPAEAKAAISFEEFQTPLMEMFEARKHEFFRRVQSLTPLVKSMLIRTFDEHIGACCFSEVPDSLLMWAHYTKGHEGFVLEFDAHHPYFHEQRSPSDEFQHIRRVIYREQRPSSALTNMDAVDMFLVKSGHWSYEREWRIFRALAEAPHKIVATPFPVYLFPLPIEAITAVILGARTRQETTAQLGQALRQSEAYAHVKIRRAVPDEAHFLLRVVDWPG